MNTKSWNEIRSPMLEDPDHETLAAEATAHVQAEEEAYALSLAQVRRARDFTQTELAEALGINQPTVSKIERQHERHADLYVSTLRRFIEAMGGYLRITAVFPDAEIPVDNFRQIDAARPAEGCCHGDGTTWFAS